MRETCARRDDVPDAQPGRDGRSTRPLLAILAGLILWVGPAQARLAQRDLDAVRVVPPADARLPADLTVQDAATEQPVTLGAVADGQVVLLLPVDYTCGNVCDPMVAMTIAALDATGLEAGDGYRLILFGLDPRDGPAAARALVTRGGGDAHSARATRAVVADAAGVARFAQATGYGFRFDAATDSFAHPAALLLFLPDGRLGRVLSPLALSGRDLRLALVEAGEGRVGGFADRIMLLCYGYDAATGAYTPMIRGIVTVSAALTVLGIGLLVLMLSRRPKPT